MDFTRSLVKLGIGAGFVLGGLTIAPTLTGAGLVLATALGNVAAGNTANAIDALIDGRRSDRVSLENEDLTKAVGKAIAAVITLAAKQHQRDTRSKLHFFDRFDATICAIAESPHPTIPTFSPQDPHLIQNIMTWVKRIILET